MAITTRSFGVYQPNAALASENPIIVGLQTHANGTENFSKSKFSFNNLSLLKDGFSVKFTPSFYTASFYAKDFPNRDMYFLSKTLKDENGTTITGNTLIQIAASFADSLTKDPILSNLYYINYTGSTNVIMQAKTASAKFDLSPVNVSIKNEVGANSTGITVTVETNGQDVYEGSLVSDYSLYVEPYFCEGVSNAQFGDTLNKSYFNRITEVELPFSLDNTHVFDLSTICKSFVFTPKPDFSYPVPSQVLDYIKPFYFRYGEKYPLVPNQPTKRKREKGSTGFKWVMNASSDLYSENDMSAYTGTSYCKFLTNSPSIKKTNKDASELLYLLLRKDYATDFKIYADFKFWDGSELNHQMVLDLFTASGNFGGCWLLPVSYNNLNFASYESGATAPIKTVTLSMRYGVSGIYPYSELKTYRYEYTQPTNRFGVAFLNKLGTYDTFDFQGLKTEEINREQVNYTVPTLMYLDAKGAIAEGAKALSTYQVNVTRKITVNSGFLTQTEFDWLLELLTSTDIYNYDGKDNSLRLDSYKYSKNNQSNEYTLEVTFLQSIQENSITK